MVRRCVLAAGLLLLLGGCGDDGAARPRRARRSRPPRRRPRSQGPIGSKAPVLVEMTMQRPGALLDKITIHTDGYGLFDRPSGGVGRVQRDVIVKKSVLERLRASLAKVHGDGGKPSGEPAANFATYMRYHGRTLVAKQGAEPQELRTPMRIMRAMLLDGEGFAKVTRERLGGVAGATHLGHRQEKARSWSSSARAAARRSTPSRSAATAAPLEKRYGGAGGRFKDLSCATACCRGRAGAVPRSGSSLTQGSPPPGGAQYLLRYRGRTFTAREGGVVPAARPAVRILDGFIDGVGVRKVTRENATHAP